MSTTRRIEARRAWRRQARMRIALVHDWLTGMRGGEIVLAELCAMFPDAPVYTLVHQPGSVPPIETTHRIVTSPLDHLPFGRSHYRLYLPLLFRFARRLHVDDHPDVVISSSHAVAKAVTVPSDAVHLCYCHAPMRYVWGDASDYFSYGWTRHVRYAAFRPFRAMLRRADVRAARNVDVFVANSNYVRDVVRNVYGRDARVVYPPVDTEYFTPAEGEREDVALIVSALVPYKRVDLAVSAFSRRGWRLRVVGDGIERRSLQRLAGPSVEFCGRVSRERLRELYRTSRMLLVPGREDFGIAPVEAQACGLPVVALAEGGALETVVDGVTGAFFHERADASLTDAVERARSAPYSVADMRANAERFSRDRFRREMMDALNEAVRGRPSTPPRVPID